MQYFLWFSQNFVKDKTKAPRRTKTPERCLCGAANGVDGGVAGGLDAGRLIALPSDWNRFGSSLGVAFDAKGTLFACSRTHPSAVPWFLRHVLSVRFGLRISMSSWRVPRRCRSRRNCTGVQSLSAVTDWWRVRVGFSFFYKETWVYH